MRSQAAAGRHEKAGVVGWNELAKRAVGGKIGEEPPQSAMDVKPTAEFRLRALRDPSRFKRRPRLRSGKSRID